MKKKITFKCLSAGSLLNVKNDTFNKGEISMRA